MPIFGVISLRNDSYPLLYIEAKNSKEAKKKLFSKADTGADFNILYEKILGKGSLEDLEEEEVPTTVEERLSILQQICAVDSEIHKLE